jgi:acetyltransferase
MHAPTAIVRSDDIARACAPLVRRGRAPRDGLLARRRGGGEARRIFEDAGVADYATPEEAVRAFAMLATYRRNQALLLEAPTASENGRPTSTRARRSIRRAGRRPRHARRTRGEGVLQAYGIPIVPTVAVEPRPTRRGRGARDRLSGRAEDPVARHQPQVRRRRRAPRLRDEASCGAAADAMLAQRARTRRTRASPASRAAMVRRPCAQELIVGASVDPLFGRCCCSARAAPRSRCIADRAIALPPLNRVLARELISRTRVASCWPATATTRRRSSTRSATC